MDVAMPVMHGIDATRQIKKAHPTMRVIGLSMLDGEGVAAMMLQAGAELHVSKTEMSAGLVQTICHLRAGRS
jgi:DNA-binding NarL/FixJ family response regulator